MVPFGGSGPLQAARVAQLLGLTTVMVPPNPGNVSAFGLLAVDLKMDYVATVVQREDRFDPNELNAAYERLEAEADLALAGEGMPPERRRFLRTADMRHFGEAYEVRIEMPAGRLDQAALQEAVERFHRRHEQLYGYSYRGTQLTEIVNLRVTGIGVIDKPVVAKSDVAPSAPDGWHSYMTRPVYFDGEMRRCKVFSRSSLRQEMRIEGPAIVEEYGSTTVIQPGQTARVDRYGNLLIAPESAS
jgi:N-methylhydantoinase A